MLTISIVPMLGHYWPSNIALARWIEPHRAVTYDISDMSDFLEQLLIYELALTEMPDTFTANVGGPGQEPNS